MHGSFQNQDFQLYILKQHKGETWKSCHPQTLKHQRPYNASIKVHMYWQQPAEITLHYGYISNLIL